MKIKIKQIFLHLLIFSLIFHNGLSENLKEDNLRLLQTVNYSDAQVQADTLTQLYSDLNSQMQSITSQQSKVSQSQDITGTLLKTCSSLSYIYFFMGPSGIALASVALAFQIMAAKQDAKVAKSIYGMRNQVISLSSSIDNLKVSVLQSLNQLDENLSFRSIDQDVFLLNILLSQYSTYEDTADILLFKQLCGEQLSNCNKAVLSLSSGLKDYLRAVKNNQGWDRYAISVQYLTYSSLLMNAVNALTQLNLKMVVQDKQLDASKLTTDQTIAYSRSSILTNALKDLDSSFQSLIVNTYIIYTKDIDIKTKSYNDLVGQDNYLLLGFYRAPSGDQLNAIVKTKVANRFINMQSNMYVNAQYVLDGNNNWVTCPKNAFLRGFHISEKYLMHNIEKIQCNTFVGQYQNECSVVDVLGFQTPNNWALCGDGKFVAGIKRGNGDDINNITQLYCCSMTSTPLSETADAVSNIVKYTTSFKPNKGDVDMTNGTKNPIQYLTISNRDLTGNFEVGFKKSGFEVEKSDSQDVLHLFDNANTIGRCPFNYYLTGFKQNNGSNFSHIETLYCAKYKNQFWEKCFYQDVNQYPSNKSCSGNNSCKQTQLKCEDGSYLAGLGRAEENNMYGVNLLFCCTMGNTQSKTINEVIDTIPFFNP